MDMVMLAMDLAMPLNNNTNGTRFPSTKDSDMNMRSEVTMDMA